MLKGLDPLLTPELLSILRAMGHGDEIVVVDGNYPANSAGPPVIRLDGEQHVSLIKLERFAFYAKAADAFAIVVTGERRLYGNIILKKGIVRPN